MGDPSDDLSYDLVHAGEPLSDAERLHLQRMLEGAERTLRPSSDAASVVQTPASDDNGLAILTRLGVLYVFAEGSLKTAAENIDAWIERQRGTRRMHAIIICRI